MPGEVEYAFDIKAATQAAERWRNSAEARDSQLGVAVERGLAAAESHERLAKRASRLIGMVARRSAVPVRLRPLIEQPARIASLQPEVLEQVIGDTRDFLSVEFLERGHAACSGVCRTSTRLTGGRVRYGTGFLVSRRLMMTNHHVLPTQDEAAASIAEFNFQMRSGASLPVSAFALDPASFFLTDEGLDFTLVAVQPVARNGQRLSDFQFCPLHGQEGKIVVTEPVNIVQHPSGRAKEVVVRENQLLHLLPNFAQYKADTEPGSSGSPVYNDQWEVVALHHSGVPKTDAQGHFLDKDGQIWHEDDDPARLAWEANEGIRVSVLVNFIRTANIDGYSANAFRDELLQAAEAPAPEAGVAKPKAIAVHRPTRERADAPVANSVNGPAIHPANGAVTVTIPLHISVALGGAAPQVAQVSSGAATGHRVDMVEAIEPDPDYDDRPGYDPDFLGFSVPLPKLRDEKLGAALEIAGASAASPFELKYYHYSVILNKARKVAYVSAVNYLANAPVIYSREGKDRWFEDPRAEGFQTGEDLYRDNPLDRGHLTRRADAAWGETEDEAKLANDDTFHFANCSPQHEVFNQGQKAAKAGLRLWGNLEDYVQRQTKDNSGRVSVFNGPVFRPSDRPYRGVQLPKEFWKLIVYKSDAGQPRAVAFVLSQDSLIKNLPLEEMEWTPYKPFQVRISALEKRTHLDLGRIRGMDALADGHEALLEAGMEEALPISRLDQIIL